MNKPKEIHAQNRQPGGWDDYFHVRGGPFSGEQTMGWHITNESGYTLAVSPDSSFVNFCKTAIELRELLKAADARYSFQRLRDEGYMDEMEPNQWERLKEILESFSK